MLLIQNGYSCERELNLFINMFFKKEEEVLITSDFRICGGIINVYTFILFEGERYEENYTLDTAGYDKSLYKKIYTAACTNSFVHAAMKIRPINLPWGVMCGIRPAKNARTFFESGLSENEVRRIFKEVYEVTEDKTELALEVSKNEREIISKIDDNSVSVYIGIPFCPTRCVYCSFVSTDIRVSGKYMDMFTEKLILEIKKTAEILGKLKKKIECIYIGGGTPTALDVKNLEKILYAVNKYWDLKDIKEFTLEAGRVDTIDADKLRCAKKYGVDRISINPQTMNDITLQRVGRRHTAEDLRRGYYLARETGFENINTDLIAGLMGEDFDMFKYSLDEVVKLDPDDITVHTLSIKHGARLNSLDVELTRSGIMNRMLSYTQGLMKSTGRIPYYMYRQKNMLGNLENVGYSYPDKMSIYNISIMEEKQTIIALGGGGSTKLVMGDRIERIFNYKDPKEYIEKFDNILSRKDDILKMML